MNQNAVSAPPVTPNDVARRHAEYQRAQKLKREATAMSAGRKIREFWDNRRRYVATIAQGTEYPAAVVLRVVEAGVIIELTEGAPQTALLPRSACGPEEMRDAWLSELQKRLSRETTVTLGVIVRRTCAGRGKNAVGKPRRPGIFLVLSPQEFQHQQDIWESSGRPRLFVVP